MMTNTIAIASDHGGFELKEILIKELQYLGYIVENLGTYSEKVSVDYPDYGHKMANIINVGPIKTGIIICGTGIGISIAANRHPNIRAALCHNVTTARLAREHNNANVLALGARVIGEEVARDCMKTFLETEFEGGRHVNRLNKVDL